MDRSGRLTGCPHATAVRATGSFVVNVTGQMTRGTAFLADRCLNTKGPDTLESLKLCKERNCSGHRSCWVPTIALLSFAGCPHRQDPKSLRLQCFQGTAPAACVVGGGRARWAVSFCLCPCSDRTGSD